MVKRKACSVYLYLLAELAQANPKQAAKIRRKMRAHIARCTTCLK